MKGFLQCWVENGLEGDEGGIRGTHWQAVAVIQAGGDGSLDQVSSSGVVR